MPLQRGTNQAGMRAQNERLVLSLVRRHGPLAKSEIARMTGLSAQTVSVIMRHLEADRLLRRGEPQRGRVGQPSVPMSLDPEGAFFLGAKVGRRSLDFVLVDFVGGIRHQSRASYPFPTAARDGAADPGRGGARARRCSASRRGGSPGSGSPCRSSSGTGRRRSARPEAELAAWRQRRHPRRAGGRAALAGLPAERRHRRLRGGARLRRQRRAAGLHLLLRRRLHRRRAGAERRALRRAHRQRGGARLDAGAGRGRRHGAADRRRLAGAARAAAAGGGAAARGDLRPGGRLVGASARRSTTGSRRRRAASPTRSRRPARSSTSRRR